MENSFNQTVKFLILETESCSKRTGIMASNLGMRGRIEYKLDNNINDKFVNVLKVRSFLQRISLSMEIREQ